jgi:hypothetical protein
MAPKSILKNSPAAPAAPAAAPPTTRNGKEVNPRHLDVALHHANIIEQRKAVEAQVLDSIMTLMDYPPAAQADPQQPAPAHARFFADAVAAFQPADYDALIEERNIAGHCGYALCPRDKRRAPSAAKKHFVDTARGVEIVDRSKLEVWCSDDCARRALYVKVQLSEDPAWLRHAQGDKIELLVENTAALHAALPVRPKQMTAPAKPTAAADDDDDIAAAWAARDDAAADLALERGEKPGAPTKINSSLVQAQITEHAPSSAAPLPPSLPTEADATMAIEGHVPRLDRADKDGGEGGESDEEDPQDWDRHLPG